MSAAFERCIGIDYSGAERCESSLKGLRVYMADRATEPREVAPPSSPRKNWTRKAIAHWLVERLSEPVATLVGIDHGFSFPLRYFEQCDLPHDWPSFLDDFQIHWPTDEPNTYVDFVREGACGNGAARCGNSRWRRITEVRAGAKSVLHFDVPGSVAKSTHAGIPWLRFLRMRVGDRVHFWPFDGWNVPAGKSAVVEVYPALWSRSFPRDGRDSHQQDAYATGECYAATTTTAASDGFQSQPDRTRTQSRRNRRLDSGRGLKHPRRQRSEVWWALVDDPQDLRSEWAS